MIDSKSHNHVWPEWKQVQSTRMQLRRKSKGKTDFYEDNNKEDYR
jgi:hypothetical protein